MILASLKPYYYYLIGERKKTIEVRKTALKNLPQDIAFYMSKDEKSFAKIPKEFQEKYRKHFGKVGIKVICDRIDEYKYVYCDHPEIGYPVGYDCGDNWYDIDDEDLQKACLTEEEFKRYGNGKPLYGWHIYDLKIYDKPKELREFRKPLDRVWGSYCNDYCDRGCISFGSTDYSCNDYWNWEKGLTRPPQSYMFVEELKEV